MFVIVFRLATDFTVLTPLSSLLEHEENRDSSIAAATARQTARENAVLILDVIIT